jgi:hypothetical protein
MPSFREENDDDNLYDDVVRMADRMGLKGPKRQEYIHDHMLQGGYEPVQSREAYAKIQQEEADDGGGGGWFGSRGQSGGRGSGGGGGRNSGRGSRDNDDSF